jgi:dTDP-4-dehydrorhamnose 3,5-epimerase
MKFDRLQVTDAFLIRDDGFKDVRGQFSLVWDVDVFQAAGINLSPWSCCHSYNSRRGTLRGMHYQKPPHEQAKLVTCVSGAVWDVIVDLRPTSPTYLKWEAVELREATGVSIYIPRGCAHGFMTLRDNSTISYLIEGGYEPKAGGILRWNDPVVRIAWPLSDPVLSDADRFAPDFQA